MLFHFGYYLYCHISGQSLKPYPTASKGYNLSFGLLISLSLLFNCLIKLPLIDFRGTIEAEFWKKDVENVFNDKDSFVKVLEIKESQWPGNV